MRRKLQFLTTERRDANCSVSIKADEQLCSRLCIIRDHQGVARPLEGWGGAGGQGGLGGGEGRMGVSRHEM